MLNHSKQLNLVLLILIIAYAIVLYSGFMNHSVSKDNSSKGVVIVLPKIVRLKDVLYAYEHNKIKANKLYKDKCVILTGLPTLKVNYIGEDLKHNKQVSSSNSYTICKIKGLYNKTIVVDKFNKIYAFIVKQRK